MTDKGQIVTDIMTQFGVATHNAYAGGIKNSIIATMKLQGAYTGLIAGPSADPYNGTYKFSIDTIPLTGSTLKTAAETSFQAWFTAIETAIKNTVFVVVSDAIVLPTPLPNLITVTGLASGVLSGFVLTIDEDRLAEVTDYNGALALVAEFIDTSLKDLDLSTKMYDALSNDSGTGLVSGGLGLRSLQLI